MHLALLSSIHPSFGHARAGNLVLATLLEELGRAGHRVSLFTACCANDPDREALDRLRAAGVTHAADLTAETMQEPRLSGLASDLRTLRKAYLPKASDDFPRFSDPSASARSIAAGGAEAAILFWDSWLEQLVAALKPLPVVGYLAKPRTASSLSAAESSPATGFAGAKQKVLVRILRNQEARHLERLRGLGAATNICALDAKYYSEHGVRCDYLPNTWPDAFGPDWRARRERAEAERGKVAVLANIGSVNGTGNLFGLRYLAGQVMPALGAAASSRMEISVCGGGRMQAPLAESLAAQGVLVRGFVDDIDGEVLSNRVFLLLNNAGPYTGGYTRVVYAFSSGACLVAHRRLAESMPEVEHGKNALLGSTPQEIAALLERAAGDVQLVRKLGEGARETYERVYRPATVAGALAACALKAAA
jgi:hypothetical protein